MSSTGHALKMDQIYGPQRLFYDATRAYYLLGRDQLLKDLRVPSRGKVLEVGCGTGRNMIRLGGLQSDVQLFGLDISSEMLRSARAAADKSGLAGRMELAKGDAERFDPHALFGVERFDCIFFSYTLSMIPGWQAALQQAFRVLKPGGALHIVDFGDCAGLPGWFRPALFAWLRAFHVTPRAELETVLRQLAADEARPISVSHPFRGYAFAATVSGTSQWIQKHAKAGP